MRTVPFAKQYPTITRFLSVKVDAVKLPDLQNLSNTTVSRADKTYPPLVLDGASGVGKTQQAFALLNSGEHSVVYVHNCTEQMERAQEIYVEMYRLTGMQKVFEAIAPAMGELEQQEKGNLSLQKDVFAVDYLKSKVKSNAHEKDSPLLAALINLLRETQQKYEASEKILKTAVKGDASWELVGTVLFIDEAIPGSTDDAERRVAIRRLRFLRNLGRALRMRVVVAGTAATSTIANVISDLTQENSRSRSAGHPEHCWSVCHLYWCPARDIQWSTDVGINMFLQEGRPLVPLLMQGLSEAGVITASSGSELLTELSKIGYALDERKVSSKGTMVDWLSGVWLDGSNIPPSPYQMKPTQLVSGGFFEPAIAVVCDGHNSLRPCVGLGFARVHRQAGSMRVFVEHGKKRLSDPLWWCVTITDPDVTCREARISSRNAAFCEGFGGVEYALSHCVQQCLAREPLLAVAMSFPYCNAFLPVNFQKQISKSWIETKAERNVGSVDGELNEAYCFSVLQLAANCDMEPGKRKNAMDFIHNVKDYMAPPKQDPSPARVFKFDLENASAAPFKLECRHPEKAFTEKEESEILEVLRNTMIPRIVPASSEKELEKQMKKAPTLFGLNEVGGLVAGETLSLVDARLMVWGGGDPWSFEFKACSSGYSTNKAVQDLKAKVGDDVKALSEKLQELTEPGDSKEPNLKKVKNEEKEKKMQKLRDELASKKYQRACHRMLVAVKDTGKPTASVWIVNEGGEKFLRVVMVLPSKAF